MAAPGVGEESGRLAENPTGLLGARGNINSGLAQGSKSSFVLQRQRQHLTCATGGGAVRGEGVHEGEWTQLVARTSVGLPSPGDGDGDGDGDDGDGGGDGDDCNSS